MTDCARAGKLFRGCKWQVMYDLKSPSKEVLAQISRSWELPYWLAELGIVHETYVGSICTTCGKTANRDGQKVNEHVEEEQERESVAGKD
jgi:hypothetical protein